MLSRTADHLFWMSRYTERAENTARMLNVGYETSLLPQSTAKAQEGWLGLLSISELIPAYTARHGAVTRDGVLDFMVRDGNNPSSILSCLRAARENARAVRGTLTTELFETTNQTWLEFQRLLDDNGTFERDPAALFEWVKFRSHLSRGVAVGTMLQDESLHFIRIGTFLERADNTARILDVKYHVQLPDVSDVGGVVDYYQWLAILRVVGARRAYRVLFKGRVQPAHVAELLISREVFPRSLAFCYEQITQHLDAIKAQDPKLAADAKRKAHAMHAHLRFANIDTVIEDGLHEYLTDVIDRTRDLGAEIARGHLF